MAAAMRRGAPACCRYGDESGRSSAIRRTSASTYASSGLRKESKAPVTRPPRWVSERRAATRPSRSPCRDHPLATADRFGKGAREDAKSVRDIRHPSPWTPSPARARRRPTPGEIRARGGANGAIVAAWEVSGGEGRGLEGIAFAPERSDLPAASRRAYELWARTRPLEGIWHADAVLESSIPWASSSVCFPRDPVASDGCRGGCRVAGHRGRGTGWGGSRPVSRSSGAT